MVEKQVEGEPFPLDQTPSNDKIVTPTNEKKPRWLQHIGEDDPEITIKKAQKFLKKYLAQEKQSYSSDHLDQQRTQTCSKL